MARENVVLIIVDDALLDIWARMTYLDSLPDGHWVKFSRAVVNYPVCAISRANIFTGRRRSNLGANPPSDSPYYHGGPADSSVVGTMAHWDANLGGEHMMPRWLQNAGYFTACYGKYLNIYPWNKGDSYIPIGWNDWKVWLDDSGLGGSHANHNGPGFLDYYMNINGAESHLSSADSWTSVGADDTGRQISTDYSTDRINSMINKFLTSYLKQPFYLHIGLFAVKQPHAGSADPLGSAQRHRATPYTPERPPSFNEADISDKSGWLNTYKPTQANLAQETAWDDDQMERWRTALAIDELVRDLITTLKVLNIYDRTCIIVTTEHSNLQGHHRLDAKGVPYEAAITTPMYVRHPDAPIGNLISDAMVSTIDIAPTFLEMAQTRPSRPMDGMSFLPLIDGRLTEPQWRQAAMFEWVNNSSVSSAIPSYKGIRTHDYKYIEFEALGVNPASVELYDLSGVITSPADTDEMVNQANNPLYAAVKADLAQQLEKLRT